MVARSMKALSDIGTKRMSGVVHTKIQRPSSTLVDKLLQEIPSDSFINCNVIDAKSVGGFKI